MAELWWPRKVVSLRLRGYLHKLEMVDNSPWLAQPLRHTQPLRRSMVTT